VTLPNEEVLALLQKRFVVGTRNIERDRHVGMSHGYRCTQTAVGTTNGAGGRNVQLVMLASDGTVLHVLPGFWHAEDLLAELRLGLELHTLYRDEDFPADRKEAMYQALHRSFLAHQSAATLARSEWQSFDVSAERSRAETEERDTFATWTEVEGKRVPGRMKPTSVLVHERMMARPFVKLAAFDMESFVDYGRAYYDNNAGLDRGKNFTRAEQANRKREREQEKAQKVAAAKPRK